MLRLVPFRENLKSQVRTLAQRFTHRLGSVKKILLADPFLAAAPPVAVTAFMGHDATR